MINEIQHKEKIEFSWQVFTLPLSFMLSLTLLGLECPIAYFFIATILYYSFRFDRYDLLIQSTFLFGVYQYYDENLSFPFKLADIGLILSFITVIIYRKDKILWKILLLTLGYFLFLFFIAKISDESFVVQLRRMRHYMYIIYFMFPLLCFGNREFDIKIFIRRVLLYAIIISIFIIFDSLIFSEHILFPRAVHGSLVYTNINFVPFSSFLRIYPQVIFISVLLIYPLMFQYSIPKWIWPIVIIATICTKTFSYMGGILITCFFFQKKIKNKITQLVLCVCLLFVGSIVDQSLGGSLRINHLLNQFKTLIPGKTSVYNDLETLASFGSTRGAQIIPKIELLTDMNKLSLGFGFLHNKETNNDEYIINNEYYSDISKAEEVATMVEVTQVQTVLDMGLIGLLVQHLFYILIYIIIRKYQYSIYYITVVVCVSVWGIGGFAGLSYIHGVLLVGLSLGSILLVNKNRDLKTY